MKQIDEKVINLVIPMAWAWNRFIKAWYDLQKPLIDVKWKPMFYWATSSFDFLKENYKINYIFIVLQEHIEKYKIDEKIKFFYNKSKIISIDKITRWQAETVLMAKKYINNLNKLIIFNSDTYTNFDENDFPIDNKKNDWIISCFKSNALRYSYVKLDKYNYVSKVAEKVVISNNATNGMYYFRSWIDFVNYAGKMINNNELNNGEFYVWPVYNYLIKNWKKIKISKIKENRILWTPEELNYFLLKNNFK